MKITKKLLAIILSLIICLGALPITTLAADIASDTFAPYGSGTWRLDSEGNLIISGEVGLSGEYNGAPWYEHRESIKTAYFTSDSYAKAGASLACMFSGCTSLETVDISRFSTSSVTSMSGMFDKCRCLTSLNLSNFDTSEVTDMSNMFALASSLLALDLSDFNTSKVTNMSNMFGGCSSLTSLGLSGFDTSKAEDMSSMFQDCSSLASLELSDFDTSKVENMSSMFKNCSSLTSLSLSNFNTPKLQEVFRMFDGCSSITFLDLSGFDTSKLINIYAMFNNCGKAVGGVPAKGFAGNAYAVAKFSDSLTLIDTNKLVFALRNFESISITAQPDKTDYLVGDSFDPTGMVVTAYYFDGTNKPITDYTVTNGNNLSLGQETVTVSYTEDGITATATVPIMVKDPKMLTAISITVQPDKKGYVAGEMFDPTGMVVTAYYLDGTNAPITDYTVTNGNNLPLGQTSVTISYTKSGITKTAVVSIKVVTEKKCKYISITSQPDKMKYTVGEDFDPTGMVVKAFYNDDTSKQITDYIILDGKNLSQNQAYYVHIKYVEDGVAYETKTGQIVITPPRKLSWMDLLIPAAKTEYIEGENFDPTGMVLKAFYSLGDGIIITDYIIPDGNNLKLGQQTVTIYYMDDNVFFSVLHPVEVYRLNKFVSIDVNGQPNKKTYIAGESFNPAGMVVTAHYWDGTEKPVLGYTIENGNNLTPDQKTVTISYTEDGVTSTVMVSISVKAPKVLSSISVTAQPDKKAYIAGENFDPKGMVVTAHYSDGTSAPVIGYIVTNGNNLASGQKSVTVSYTEDGITETAVVPITVKAPKALASIGITAQPTKTDYTVGESFASAGMSVTAYYTDSTSAPVVAYTVTNGNNLALGQKSVTVSYTEDGITKTAAVGIKVSDKLVVVYGDVDGDGEVLAKDARLCLRAAVGLEVYAEGSYEYLACDVDGNPKITASDARLVLRRAVGLDKSFPVEDK